MPADEDDPLRSPFHPMAPRGVERRFQVSGLELRWDFGLDDDGNYEHAFVIQPDGTGLYCDFSRSTGGTARPSQTFKCEQSP